MAERREAEDDYTGGECLDDQTGDGSVKTFSFAIPMQLVWVRVVGGVGRADPFGGTPTSTKGVYCAADEPAPLTIATKTVKVFAPGGTTISVWGYRH